MIIICSASFREFWGQSTIRPSPVSRERRPAPLTFLCYHCFPILCKILPSDSVFSYEVNESTSDGRRATFHPPALFLRPNLTSGTRAILFVVIHCLPFGWSTNLQRSESM